MTTWPPLPPMPPTPTPEPVTPAEAFTAGGKAFPGVHCFDGKRHAELDACAAHGARLCVEKRSLNHWQWAARKRLCEDAVPGVNVEEIAGMTWRDRMGEELAEAARSIFKSFRGSYGHWRIASQPWRLWGAGMERDGDTWYGVIVVGDDLRKFAEVSMTREHF